MKIYSSEALAALEAGEAIVSGAVKIATIPDPVLLWGGYGVLTLGELVFQGVGDHGLAQVAGGALGGAAQGVTLSLSGIDPDVMPLFDATNLRRAPVVIWRLVFSITGKTLLDARVYTRGRVDQVKVRETPGGAAEISVQVEGAARGLGRAGGRMRTDADQRMNDDTDPGFTTVSYAGEKTMYWGGQRPANAGSAFPGATGAGFGGGVVGGGALSRD